MVHERLLEPRRQLHLRRAVSAPPTPTTQPVTDSFQPQRHGRRIQPAQNPLRALSHLQIPQRKRTRQLRPRHAQRANADMVRSKTPYQSIYAVANAPLQRLVRHTPPIRPQPHHLLHPRRRPPAKHRRHPFPRRPRPPHRRHLSAVPRPLVLVYDLHGREQGMGGRDDRGSARV
jgi:hypothetical protein